MVVTNPSNQIIDKPKVLERVRGNIIRYTSMTKDMTLLTRRTARESDSMYHPSRSDSTG